MQSCANRGLEAVTVCCRHVFTNISPDESVLRVMMAISVKMSYSKTTQFLCFSFCGLQQSKTLCSELVHKQKRVNNRSDDRQCHADLHTSAAASLGPAASALPQAAAQVSEAAAEHLWRGRQGAPPAGVPLHPQHGSPATCPMPSTSPQGNPRCSEQELKGKENDCTTYNATTCSVCEKTILLGKQKLLLFSLVLYIEVLVLVFELFLQLLWSFRRLVYVNTPPLCAFRRPASTITWYMHPRCAFLSVHACLCIHASLVVFPQA